MTETDILLRAAGAALAGGLIGLERSYRGRAAGLRTYTLVAMAASLLVALAQYAPHWSAAGTGDPTRVVQGIVTGIGFLGAGVIIREGFSVRGLTTAASIWSIAAIGMVFGTGLMLTGAVATIATWIALELLRQLESRVPTHSLVHCDITFRRADAWDDAQLQAAVSTHGFTVGEVSTTLDSTTQSVRYELVMWSTHADASHHLSRALLSNPSVLGYHVAPGRD